jgi:mono/diheme cytochrome c family protein
MTLIQRNALQPRAVQRAACVQRGAARPLLLIIVALLVVAGAYGLWIITGPGPMDFAAGKRAVGNASVTGTGVPAELANASLVERGRYLARAADCTACHTTGNGPEFAGGRAFVLPFGTLYSTNITPDRETGIGAYTDGEFLRALHEGVGRTGARLYPAMPYASYTYMSDADALAIKAYLFSLPAVHTALPANTLSFPFNQRWLMSIWSGFFNPDKRFQANSERSAEWNRGAYLAEAMAHCGECHTPRTVAFSLDNRRKYAGEKQAGWIAYNITSDKPTGIGDWTPEELGHYLAQGHAAKRGGASGPMGEAVDLSLRYLTQGDIAALAAYVSSVPAVRSHDAPLRTTPAPASHAQGVTAAIDPRGKEIYEGACAGCHGWTGISPVIDYASLTGTRAINDPSATNVVQVVLNGSTAGDTQGDVSMPGFGRAYTDREIAAVANYVTARFGAKASSVNAAGVAQARREVSR